MTPSPESGISPKAREAEYQALWQVCDRASRGPEYEFASDSMKHEILDHACREILAKRVKEKRTMCGTDINKLIKSQMKRKANSQILAAHRLGQTPIIEGRPLYNAIPQACDAPAQFNANPVAYVANPQVYQPIPQPQIQAQPQPHVQPVAVPIAAPTHRYKFRSDSRIHKPPPHHDEDIQTLINTLKSHDHRIAALENHIKEVTYERDMLRAAPMYAQPLYNQPMNGIEGLDGAIESKAHSQKIPSPPRSQTQNMGEDDTEVYQLQG
ncbi:hypothetical protein F53441_7471 [Fusarium austroafricanum]|uniref:Uncharacterized protein n=1 Tax=Fusarium austroafricanum TaxID=2364996 RepID=A0A8H4KGH4_9HYPO|nr:hypothetical protein F53441_7471 [Fusarium austroafricanum]